MDLVGLNPRTVKNIQVFASFEYLLSQKLQIEMIGMIHANIDSPNGVSKVYVDGKLRFEQDSPILIDSIKRTLYNEDPLDAAQYQKFTMAETLESYFNRNGE